MLFFSLVCLQNITEQRNSMASPGGSPKFGLYDSLLEFLISAKRKEIHNDRAPELQPYAIR